jgi:hypothetical protein
MLRAGRNYSCSISLHVNAGQTFWPALKGKLSNQSQTNGSVQLHGSLSINQDLEL